MLNRMSLATLMIAAATSTSCIFGDYEDVMYPMYGEMTFVPSGYTCSGEGVAGKVGSMSEFVDGEYPTRVSIGGECLVPNVPEEWNPGGSDEPARFGFSSRWPDGVTMAEIGPTNEWFAPPAVFYLVVSGSSPPGCFGNPSGEQNIEMFIAGEMPDFDHIDIRAAGDCGRANFHIPGGESQ